MILNEAKNIIDITGSSSIFNAKDFPSGYSDSSTYNKNWYKYQNHWYYFKDLITEDEVTSELLGSYVAKYLDLPTINYQIAKLNDSYGLISEDLEVGKNIFKDFYFWRRRYTNFYEFLININQDFGDLLTLQFFKIALLNIYLDQKDFNTGSLLFKKEDNNLKLLGVLDFEKAMITRQSKLKLYSKLYTSNRFFSNQLKDIPYILKDFPKFRKEIKKILNLDVLVFLNKIEQDYGIKMTSYLKNNCIDNEKIIKKVINKYVI